MSDLAQALIFSSCVFLLVLAGLLYLESKGYTTGSQHKRKRNAKGK